MKLIYKISFILIFLLLLVKTFNYHKDHDLGNWRNQIWADRAGYFIYLPATFIYNFETENLPENIVAKTGNGFKIENDKIKTKYPAGVAILQSPFYLFSHLAAKISGGEQDGFSKLYLAGINIGAVFYLTAGLILLFLFLKRRFSDLSSFIAVIIVLIGTHLLYYSYNENLMSHLYSFFLFSALLLTTDNLIKTDFKQKKYIIAFGIVTALIFLSRYINIIFPVLILLFFDTTSLKSVKRRILKLVNPRFFIIALLVFLPIISIQMIYWKYASGQFFYYSYGNEGFNWFNPEIIKLLFSPKNGLFLYTPLFIILTLTMLIMVIRKKKNSLLILSVFAFTIYLFSCWHNWYYGCSLSQRTFVEYAALYSIPLAYLTGIVLKNKHLFIKISLSLIMLLIIVFNYKLSINYDGCYFGGTWDWGEYKHVLKKNHIPFIGKGSYTYFTDFESSLQSDYLKKQKFIKESDKAYSGKKTCKLDKSNKYSCTFERELNNSGIHNAFQIKASIYCKSQTENKLESNLVIQVTDKTKNEIRFYKAKKFHATDKWTKISYKCEVRDFPDYFIYSVYVWNNSGDLLLLDDMRIEIEEQKDKH